METAPVLDSPEEELLDPRPEVDMLLSTIEVARGEEGQELSPLLQDIVTFMQESPQERFELHEDVPAGRLLKEGDPIAYLYILLASETPPRASKNVEIGNAKDEVDLGLLRLPTVIGEVSKLLDGQATANVDITSPTTLLMLSSEQFLKMSTSESFQKHHTDLANERLQRQLDIMERVDTIMGTRGTEEQPLSLADQIGLDGALEEALQNGKAVRRFELAGNNRTTHEYKQQGFIASFERTPEGRVVVDITGSEEGSKIIIPLKISDGGKFVATERRTVFMDTSDGYGFYSQILRVFLAKAEVFESETTEKHTTDIINGYRLGQIIPNSVLAAGSPIIAARPEGFISYVRGKEFQIMSYRVDTQLSRILRLAKDMEKDVLNPSQNLLSQKYKLPKSDISRILMQLAGQYMQSEYPSQLPDEAQKALSAQVERIQELCSTS